MARLPDPQRSRAILVGCGRYEGEQLPSIPAVLSGLHDLATVLTDLGGLPCSVVADPATAVDVGTPLEDAARVAEDVLVFYFAGHGLVDQRGELYLGVARTDPDNVAFTAVPFKIVGDALTKSRARVRIVVLDCCFSARSFAVLSSREPNLAALGEVSGTFVLASSASNAVALARPGEPYTAFTGELIRLLSQGIPGRDPVLSLDVVYHALRQTMVTLGYPEPQVRITNTAHQIGLVRNRAFNPEFDVIDDPAADQPNGPLSRQESISLDDELEWSTDAPASADQLHRAPIATVIALRLIETHVRQPDVSFLMLLDGPWGSGKSTLLNLLEPRLDDYFRVVRFDAWQQSRLAPAWWSLLTSLRREVTRTKPWPARNFVRIWESMERIRRAGAPYLTAFIIIAVTALVAAYLIWPVHSAALKTWQEVARGGVAILTGAGILCAGALWAAKLLLWDSVRGARLFEQTQVNPLADIARHFRWLMTRSNKPVVFFIDDLDRCEQAYVVEFLDTVHTLVRDTGDTRKGGTAAAYFIVAADSTWLRRSYESAHADFVECLTPAGASNPPTATSSTRSATFDSPSSSRTPASTTNASSPSTRTSPPHPCAPPTSTPTNTGSCCTGDRSSRCSTTPTTTSNTRSN